MAAFATPQNMLDTFDARTLGDLCSDDAHRVSEAALLTDPKMLRALNFATGRIMGACLRAKRYSRDDLEGLTGESEALLIDMTCRVALWWLWQRKPYTDDQQRQQAKVNSDEALEQMRMGDHVFDVEDAKEAGLPSAETVTRVEIERDWSLFVDEARGNFYPRRRTYRQR